MEGVPQVVPISRQFEVRPEEREPDRKCPRSGLPPAVSPGSKRKSEPVHDSLLAKKEAKKSFLENICSSLKEEKPSVRPVNRIHSLDDKQNVEEEQNMSSLHGEYMEPKSEEDDDYDDDKLIIVQPSSEEAVPVPDMDSTVEQRSDSVKECPADKMDTRLMSSDDFKKDMEGRTEDQQTLEEKWRYWKEGLTEDQLERRRR